MVDDVADAQLFELLLGFPRGFGLADAADLGVGRVAAPGAVGPRRGIRDQPIRDGQIFLKVHHSGPFNAGSSSGCSTKARRSSRVASTQSASGERNTPPE